MIIFMAGFPKAGKSHVANLIKNGVVVSHNCEIISPRDYLSEEYSTMDEGSKRVEGLAAWDLSLEVLSEQVRRNKDNEVIIYDTACATHDVMTPYFKLAKSYGHRVYYVFVRADLDVCKKRAGKDCVPDSVIANYSDKFEKSVPELVKLSDNRFFIENNVDKDPDVSKIIKQVLVLK